MTLMADICLAVSSSADIERFIYLLSDTLGPIPGGGVPLLAAHLAIGATVTLASSGYSACSQFRINGRSSAGNQETRDGHPSGQVSFETLLVLVAVQLSLAL